MTLQVPLSVRVKTRFRDLHISDDLTDLQFTASSPGGFAEATMSLHRPISWTPGELLEYARVYVYDSRSAATVWEGRLQDPGRTAGDDGEVYRLAAVGGVAHLEDRTVPYVIIDTSLDRLERMQFSTENPKGDKRVDMDLNGITPSLWLTAQTGSAWAQNSTATMVYSHIRNAGMKLGSYSVSGDCGAPSTDKFFWQTVTRSPAGTGTVDRDVVFTATGIAASNRNVGVSFPDGDDRLELRMQQKHATTQTAGDLTWCIFANFTVTAKLMDKAGNELGSSYPYNNGYVTADEVVSDMLGRLLPEIDGANAQIGGATYNIDTLAYPDGVTPAQVLADLMGFEQAYTYHVWESNPANDDFRFEWIPWPSVVRYEADVTDGFEASGSAASLYNQVTVRYVDARGLIRSVTRTQAVTALTDAGYNRKAFIDLGSETASSANATQAGDRFLAEHKQPVNAGRLTVRRQILDVQYGMMTDPWKIRPGCLIRVRGVSAYPDSLNVTDRDGTTVFRVAAVTYDAGDATATLDLDTYAPDVARAIANLLKIKAARRRR